MIDPPSRPPGRPDPSALDPLPGAANAGAIDALFATSLVDLPAMLDEQDENPLEDPDFQAVRAALDRFLGK